MAGLRHIFPDPRIIRNPAIRRRSVNRAPSVIRSARSEDENGLQFHPPRPRPGGPASLCALDAM
eukprot:8127339-Alexandrium_andersonii.AAC.1